MRWVGGAETEGRLRKLREERQGGRRRGSEQEKKGANPKFPKAERQRKNIRSCDVADYVLLANPRPHLCVHVNSAIFLLPTSRERHKFDIVGMDTHKVTRPKPNT